MAAVAVLGEEVVVAGYALAGALVLAADDPDAVLSSWTRLTGDGAREVAVVVLSPHAADVLGDRRDHPEAPLSVVMPR